MPRFNQYIKKVEAKIRQYPGQWLMFRKFWVMDPAASDKKYLSSEGADAGFAVEKGKTRS